MSDARLLALIVALPFAGACVLPWLRRFGPTVAAWAAAIAPATALALLLRLAGPVLGGDAVTAHRAWVPALGLDVAVRLDGLAFLFALLILAIGLLVILYARYYLGPDGPAARFHALLLAFMGAMLGIALSDNLLLTVVFWETTSLASFLLIGFWQHRADARAGARMALTVTGMGGLALLAGALLLGHMGGTLSISGLNANGAVLRAHPWYPVALLLVLLGAFTKSAQFPFHFWLPNAMAAPTPVSAYLHSATMVKAGVFLLARLHPALAGTDAWFHLVAGTGLATLVFGAWVALFRHDLKSLLAYSTISHLGLITLLLGLGSPLAAVAAVFHLVNHAVFKASLFMAAGIIDHETGTRDLRRLRGLWRVLPITGALATIAAGAMAGVPLLNGFLSKEMLFAETLDLSRDGVVAVLVPVASLLAATFGVAYSLRFIHDTFFNGALMETDRPVHEPARWMRIPVEILVVLCVAIGLAPGFTVAPLLEAAGTAVLGGPAPDYSLALWHGFTAPFAMSLFALAAGTVLYFGLQRRAWLHGVGPGEWSGPRVFEAVLRAVGDLAARSQRLTAGAGLQRQVALLLVVALVVALAPFLDAAPARALDRYTPMSGVAVAGWIVLAVATAFTVAMHRQRFAAVILTGAAGAMVAGAFAHFSAPDLALTQIAVEIVTVLLMLLALPHLPPVTPLESSPWRRWRDAAFAIAGGLAMGGGAWWMLTRDGVTVAVEQAARSVAEGGGANVVNVILVDFRGFDTYGEITVLAVAALGVVAMLAGTGAAPTRAEGRMPTLSLLARVLVPLALLLGLFLYLRGHDRPGGGFVAGLVTAIALVFLRMAEGNAVADALLRLDFRRMAAAGLAIAGLTGAGAWLWGRPFLTSAHGHLPLPVVGDVVWASAAAFDLGVWLVVVGVVMLVCEALGRLAPEAP